MRGEGRLFIFLSVPSAGEAYLAALEPGGSRTFEDQVHWSERGPCFGPVGLEYATSGCPVS